jgi:uncharacterized protein YdeI (YjbR/CyaY-like superfamily)
MATTKKPKAEPALPRFFRKPADFRKWLQKNHASAGELLVGYWKVASGEPSMSWPESVDEALCFGWIDGVRRRIDDTSYSIRFTPRKPTSTWSAVNIKRVAELTAQGLMQPAGLEAFERRRENRSGIYAYEQRRDTLDPQYEAPFKKNPAAWKFFSAQPASYRKVACWWVVSAKREETRLKRLATLIADSQAGRRLGQTTRYLPPKS